MDAVARSIERVARGMGLVAIFAIAAMMVITVADVFGRYLLAKSIAGVFEFTELLVAISVYFAAAYTQSRRGHITIEMLTSRLSPRTRLILEGMVFFIAAVFSALMLAQIGNAALFSWQVKEMSLGIRPIPLWIAKSAVTLGLLTLTVQLLLSSLDSFTRRFRR